VLFRSDSISLLDQIVSDPQETITIEDAQRILGTANTGAVKELIEALIQEDTQRGLHVINNAVDSGSDPRQFGMQVVEHLRNVLLAQTASPDLVEASTEDRQLYSQQADMIDRKRLLRAIRTFNEAVNDYRGGWQPQLSLELALIDSVHSAEETVVVQQVVQQQPQSPASEQVKQAFQQDASMELGKPPVIDAGIVRKKWNDMLRKLSQLNPSAPAVLQMYRVHHVDGNVLYICTDHELYYQRLSGESTKLNIVERALWDVHKVGLRVQVILVENMEQINTGAAENTDDPLIRAGIEELGGEFTPDDKQG
jgi:DNA polymerase III subunit gamma/tau